MGGRGRLVSGFRPWLADHRGADGWEFNRYIRAAKEIVGPLNGSESLRVEVERYAKTGVAYEIATRAWSEAVAKRETGRGRRPSARTVERCARRMGLADLSLKDATARLEALAGRRPTPAATPEELMRRLRDEAETDE
jgi:hypothetical protein